MKALIVKYLPGGSISNTRKLLEAAEEFLRSRKAQVETLDLTQDWPDFFTPERLAIYYERNYGGMTVSPERKAIIAKMDRMTGQLKGADILVLAYPMHNFSFPAPVKAWFDSVMQKGETWDIGPSGFVGLLKGKKALVLTSSGGVYEGPMVAWEHSESLAKVELGFMGLEAETVTAAGMNKFPDKVDATIAAAQKKALAVLEKWLA